MFSLHENTQRRIAVAIFFALAVVPTVAVLLWCIDRNLPGHLAAETRRLKQQLGMGVSIEDLQHPRPGTVLYRGVELIDPESDTMIARCRLLEATYGSRRNQHDQPRPTLMLTISQPQIPADQLAEFGRLLTRLMQLRATSDDFDVQWSAGEVTLLAGRDSQTLTELFGTIEHTPGESQTQTSFHLAGADSSEPIQLRWVRNRQTQPTTSALEFDTGGGVIPCSVLATCFPTLKSLGPACQFRGYCWANQTSHIQQSEAFNAEVTGQLINVDLDRLISDHFPHKLGGTAQVTIQKARFQDGRLQAASGTLTGGPGVVSRSLIVAAARRMGLIGELPPERLEEMVAYEQLGLSWKLGPQGLLLRGLCEEMPGAVLTGHQHCLLHQGSPEPVPLVAFMRTLVPQNELQVPASRQTDWLLRRLPVARVIYPSPERPVVPEARLRLGRPRLEADPPTQR